MNDSEILHQIDQLVKEEHALMQKSEHNDLSVEEHTRMKALEVALDQCWDLLRQRRARRHAGLDPEGAAVRDETVVEHYQQ